MLLQCCCFSQPPTLFKVPSFAEMFPIEWFSYHLTYPKSLWLSSCAVKRRAKGCERERNFILFLSNISPKAYLLVFWVKIITFFGRCKSRKDLLDARVLYFLKSRIFVVDPQLGIVGYLKENIASWTFYLLQLKWHIVFGTLGGTTIHLTIILCIFFSF